MTTKNGNACNARQPTTVGQLCISIISLECRLLLACKCSRMTISIGFCAAQNMRRNTKTNIDSDRPSSLQDTNCQKAPYKA